MNNPTYRRKYQPLPDNSPIPQPTVTAGKWDFWELWSGTGKLSKAVAQAGMKAGPLVSREYGWEIGLKSHQDALMSYYEAHLPTVVFGAPTCGAWSSSNTTTPHDVLESIREIETETFKFYVSICKRQHARRCYHVMEQPRASELLRTASATLLCTLYGATDYNLCMCAHG